MKLGTPYKQDKRDRRNSELLDAAAHTFRVRGYEATTMQDIASSLGMRAATLYHYTESKEHLLESICLAVAAHYNGSLKQLLESGSSAPEMIRQAIALHLHPDWFNHAGAFAFFRGNLSPRVKRRLNVLAKENLKLVEQIIEVGVKEASLRPTLDCQLTAASLVAMCNGIIGMLEGASRARIAAICEHLFENCLNGLVKVHAPLRAGTRATG